MLRLGLCCQFVDAPIHFRTTTASYLLRQTKSDRLHYVGEIIFDNCLALEQALRLCATLRIGSFRINSRFFPVCTHPEAGYQLQELPNSSNLQKALASCRSLASQLKIRLTFHPDQFVVLNSPRQEVIDKSIEELLYHDQVASELGADVINIHAGGSYGDKEGALKRLAEVIATLPQSLLAKLTLENDDKQYAPADLLPLCRKIGIPLVYDIHHHRCYPDGLTVAEATQAAISTWDREPLFHISSPIAGWDGPHPERHHDLINPEDFPREWLDLDITVEVEAKLKERAVVQLQQDLTSLRLG